MNFFTFRKKHIVIISLLLVLIVQGCVQRIDWVVINGQFSESPKSLIYLSMFEGDTLTLIDSIEATSKGKFKFKLKTEEPVFLTVGLQKKQSYVILLIQPGDEVRLLASKSDLSDYVVFGSNGSVLMKSLANTLNDAKQRIDSLRGAYEYTFQQVKTDSIRLLADSLYHSELKKHKALVREFIMNNTFSPTSIFALFQAYDLGHPVFDYSEDRKLFRLVDSTLMSVYSTNKMILNYHRKIQKLDSLSERNRKREAMFKVGEVLPNVGFPLVTGDNLYYSGIWYKYLLVDFGGSWCELCEKNSTRLKSIYKEFSPRGLALVHVSLGESVDSLKVKVVRDTIAWYSVGLMDMYNSKLLDTLKISSIPSNYIIDRWGVIKAVNLGMDKLNLKLYELLPK